MLQPKPTDGKELVFPEAMRCLREFVDGDRPELNFALEPCIARLHRRVEQGHAKYGTYLKTFNGRDAIRDAWEEAADLVFYLTQAGLECENPGRRGVLWSCLEKAQEALLLLTEEEIATENHLGGR